MLRNVLLPILALNFSYTSLATAQTANLSRNEKLSIALAAALETLPSSVDACDIMLGKPSKTDISGPVQVEIKCGGQSWSFLADQNPYGQGFSADDMSARISRALWDKGFAAGAYNFPKNPLSSYSYVSTAVRQK